MSFQTARRHYVVADIEPVIAVAEATRWARDNHSNLEPRPVLVVAEKMAEARRLRSAYQHELMGRCFEMIATWFFVSHGADAPAKSARAARSRF